MGIAEYRAITVQKDTMSLKFALLIALSSRLFPIAYTTWWDLNESLARRS
jgi:hypothetical protein